MKLPNNYGNISKLPGKRRKPWRVRKTTGWIVDETTGTRKQQYQTVGYFETKAEAHQALAEFNANPYTVGRNVTFEEIYTKWSAEKFETISKSNVNGYKASYAVCSMLYKMQFAEIRKSHLQGVIDSCGKNYPTLRKLKVLFNQLYRYALENDVCQKDYSEFVDIVKHKDRNQDEKRKPFSSGEISSLWDSATNEYIQTFLMLIYSGVRISELLELKKCSIHMEKRYFDVINSKTEAGIRSVPIAAKTLPFFKNWMEQSECEYLLCSPDGKPFKYRNYYDSYWKPLLEDLGMEHTPHDTRHTCISLLAKANISQTIIKRIVGHSGAQSLTERVYTHFGIEELIEAIDKI